MKAGDVEALEALLDAQTVSSRFTEAYTTAAVEDFGRLANEQTDRTP